MLKSAPGAETAPDSIVVVSLAPEPVARLVNRRLARLFPHSKITPAASLGQAASAEPEARIVLAMLDPVEAVATLLAERSTRPDEAASGATTGLQAWIEATAPTLEATRHLRRRLWLVDARAMADGRPQALAPEPEGTLETPDLTPPPAPRFVALAEQVIRSTPQAARLAAEIAALRRGPGGLPLDLDLAFADLIRPAQETTELALLRETLALVQTELDANAEALAAAQQDLAAQDALKAEVARLQAELVEKDRLTQEVSLLGDTLAMVRTELDANAEALAAAQQDLAAQDALKAEVARLQAELVEKDRLTQEVSLLGDTLAMVRTELDANAEALAAAQQDLAAQDALKAEVARLQAELVEKDRLTQEVSLLGDTLAMVRTELDANAEALAAAQQDLAAQDALKAEVARLPAALAGQERLTQEVSLLRETLALLQGELETSARAQVTAQQERLDHAVVKAQFDAAERQLAETAEQARLRQEVLAAEILKMNGILGAERAQFGADLQSARAEIGVVQGQLQVSQAETAGVQADLQAARAEIDMLRGQLQAADAETADLQGRVQAALHEVDLLHASTSWQVTAPLRAVKRRLAGQ
jgi:pyrimidine operon attenuation protein/uracil phosphoribosyltransferase